MNRKKMWLGIITITFLLGIAGCATFSTPNTDRWIGFELHPSRINFSGAPFYEGRFSDGTGFSVAHDRNISLGDRRFYYTTFRQDLGWHSTGEGWRAPQGTHRPRLGHLYVNPRRRIGIYFYPSGGYDVFRIIVENEVNP